MTPTPARREEYPDLSDVEFETLRRVREDAEAMDIICQLMD